MEKTDDEHRLTRFKIMKELDYCSRMTHKVDNFSLIKRTGSLKTIKGTCTLTDRIDTLVYHLNEFCLGRSGLILFHCLVGMVMELYYLGRK